MCNNGRIMCDEFDWKSNEWEWIACMWVFLECNAIKKLLVLSESKNRTCNFKYSLIFKF